MITRHSFTAIDRPHATSIVRDIAVLTTSRIVEWGWNDTTGHGYIIIEEIIESSDTDIEASDND